MGTDQIGLWNRDSCANCGSKVSFGDFIRLGVALWGVVSRGMARKGKDVRLGWAVQGYARPGKAHQGTFGPSKTSFLGVRSCFQGSKCV
jgi:hypothetical protein